MTDGKVTYSSHGLEIEEDVTDREFVEALEAMTEEEISDQFRYWTVYDRRLQQIAAEVKKRKENKIDD